MHPKVLSKTAWRVVARLTGSGLLQGWTLAGGTGLALQIGHRVSEDLDFFRAEPFEPSELIEGLSRLGEVVVDSTSGRTLHARLEGFRLSFLGAEAPLLHEGEPYRGLVIADQGDVAVMKLVAIGGRGSRKDFVDLYFCLQALGGLDVVFELLRRRFERVEYNEHHLMKSLVYFDDAESEPMPRMLREVGWDQIKQALIAEVRRLER